MTAARHPFAIELRALLAIAQPLAAANVAQMLMGLTSTIMVGHLGSAALASAGLGGSLYFHARHRLSQRPSRSRATRGACDRGR